jgi:hypothetical protein
MEVNSQVRWIASGSCSLWITSRRWPKAKSDVRSASSPRIMCNDKFSGVRLIPYVVNQTQISSV